MQITPCLWFDNQALEAATYYTSIFKNSKIETISRYTSEGREIHGQEEVRSQPVFFERYSEGVHW